MADAGTERQACKTGFETGKAEIEQVSENARGGKCGLCRELKASIMIEDSRGVDVWICMRCDRLIDWQEPRRKAGRGKNSVSRCVWNTGESKMTDCELNSAWRKHGSKT